MELKYSATLETLVNSGGETVLLTGFVVRDEKSKYFRLYPELDASEYMVIAEAAVLSEVTADQTGDIARTYIVSSDAEIEHVERTMLIAGDLLKKSKPDYKCGRCCGSDDVGLSFLEKDRLRGYVIELAKALAHFLGDSDLRCGSSNSVSVGCCRAWNRLINAVRGGGNTFDAANDVIATCSGIG